MNTALILSGGTGTRLGSDIPKQYIDIDGRPVISYCLEVAEKHPMIDKIYIAADEAYHDFILSGFSSDKFAGFSIPGENRQMSVYNGLKAILENGSENDFVLIHDAARPLVSAQTITECFEAAKNHDGAIPVLPMKDTVYLSENGSSISSLIPREKLYSGQAPEVFILGKYYSANETLLPDRILSINGSTEPAVIAGMDIVMIKGDERNFKITTKADLERFSEIIKQVKK